jgi:hypothetical protein
VVRNNARVSKAKPGFRSWLDHLFGLASLRLCEAAESKMIAVLNSKGHYKK